MIISRSIATGIIAGMILSASCASTGTGGDYRHKASYEGQSISAEQSDQKIAGDSTWQLFITLQKPEKCIKIVFSSKVKVETLKEPVASEINTYFIIEKIVDISRYNIDKKNIFYEIGRNFDLRWNVSPLVVICADDADPLKKLDAGLYRIRFTGLKSTNFLFRVEIYSEKDSVKFGF